MNENNNSKWGKLQFKNTVNNDGKVNFTGLSGAGAEWGQHAGDGARNNGRSPRTSSAQTHCQSQLSHSGGNWWFQELKGSSEFSISLVQLLKCNSSYLSLCLASSVSQAWCIQSSGIQCTSTLQVVEQEDRGNQRQTWIHFNGFQFILMELVCVTTPFHVHLSFLVARPADFRTSTRCQVTDFVVGLPQLHNYIGSYQHNKFLFFLSLIVALFYDQTLKNILS